MSNYDNEPLYPGVDKPSAGGGGQWAGFTTSRVLIGVGIVLAIFFICIFCCLSAVVIESFSKDKVRPTPTVGAIESRANLCQLV